MEEKDEVILTKEQQAEADALREEKSRIEREKRKTLFKGMFLGALTMLALCMSAVIAVTTTLIKKGSAGQTAISSADSQVLSASVQGKINRLVSAIETYYYGDVDTEDLTEGLYKGLFEGIGDKYAAYYTADEYESMMISTTDTLCGIGVVMSQDPDTKQVSVVHVYDDTPAKKAGIEAGDVIVSADGTEASSVEFSQLVTLIRGKKGTSVHLKLYRSTESDYIELDVIRDDVKIPTVSGQMLEDDIGYIIIAEFGSNTAQEFSDAYAKLEKEGMTSLIVDLRDNPGGMITSVITILDQILPEGVVVSTETKKRKKKEYTSDASCIDIPLAILINGNSASSSEIFAGAIRDFKYGTLIGTTTYGKGIVQSIKKLADGSAYKLTTAAYFTPNGDNIQDKGIDPDVELEYEYLDPDGEVYDYKQDNQVKKAIEILTDQMT